jgi:Zn-dependent protease/CBS domain-containing protein
LEDGGVVASFRLGKVAGVPVAVNWSVLVIFVLLAGGLSVGQFPRVYPGQPGWAYWLAGIAAAIVFFFGLLAHEVSHAIVAKRNGVAVRGITLWMFGGVAELEGEAPNPGSELRIAGIGPLVSLATGIIFTAAAIGIRASGQHGLVVGALGWLGGINIALAVFNVLPAAPLDGGRLLRSALWKWRGDRGWAVLMSARAGRVLGWLLVALGLWQFVLGAGVAGLWLALIGWFVISAATAEERQESMGRALAGVRVSGVMSPQPQTAAPDITVAEFLDRYLFAYRHTAFPLVEGDQPVGLVTLDRVRGVPADQRATTTLREVACQREQLVLADPAEPLTHLLPRLNECGDHRALVVTEGRLVGIVSPSDINRALMRATPGGLGGPAEPGAPPSA